MKNRIKIAIVNMHYLFALTENFEKEVMLEGKTKTVLVPAGFLTDFASVPEALWFWISPFGKHQEAALIHDCLYGNKGAIQGIEKKLTRKEADELFYQIMLKDGVNKNKAKAMKLGVRLFGWKYWKK